MNQPEFTREELLKMLPKMDLSNNPRSNDGSTIPARKGANEVLAYEQFINGTSNPNLNGQTFAIGFNSRKLIDWLQQNGDNIDAVEVYITLDDDKRLNVVLWPYNAGLPAIKPEGKAGGSTLLSPYNIGGRQP